MKLYTLTSIVSAIIFGAFSSSAQETITVDWVIPGSDSLPSQTAKVGDTVVFEFSAIHNVYIHPTGTCAMNDRVLVGRSSPASYEFTEDDAVKGEIVFACDVGPHCELGQIITFAVSALEPETFAPTSTPSGATSESPTVSNSTKDDDDNDDDIDDDDDTDNDSIDDDDDEDDDVDDSIDDDDTDNDSIDDDDDDSDNDDADNDSIDVDDDDEDDDDDDADDDSIDIDDDDEDDDTEERSSSETGESGSSSSSSSSTSVPGRITCATHCENECRETPGKFKNLRVVKNAMAACGSACMTELCPNHIIPDKWAN